MLPLSFVFFDWERQDEELSDPLALLEALRLNGDRFSVFCQAGNIRLPTKYSPLVTFLEPCIHEVQPEEPGGVFHPKVWVVRYVDEDDSVKYRVLCLSRNLTFDRSWDTVVALDGELTDRTRAISANRPLAEFVEALPNLCVHPLAAGRRRAAHRMADELLRVRFEWPEGFDASECRFWTSGLSGKRSAPFGEKRDQSLIVSPFLSDSVIRDFLMRGRATHLVSRAESLQDIPVDTLKGCKSVHFLRPQLSEEAIEEPRNPEPDEVLEGLHAKLFVIDRGWSASVFSGSFNATNHALERNVEFMVEMVGKKSKVGVDRFLAGEKGVTGFSDLLQIYGMDEVPMPTDPLRQEFDDLFRLLKREVIEGRPRIIVSAGGQPALFNMRLQWNEFPTIADVRVRVKAWPITLPEERAQPFEPDMAFREVSHEALTPLLAICLQCEIAGKKRESSFVLNLPLEGAPADRQDRVVAALLQGKEQLLRYILFLLAAGDGDGDAAASGELATLLQGAGDAADLAITPPCLLETMLRALHRGPAQMERVASLLETLQRCGKSSDLVGPEFQSIWEPIWEVAKQSIAKK
ncbi:phospholipase D family protein [Luteolibacter flavescens]|uniref:Phospholipase D family protein n=1 Tax=Luteolibacter flavescens TaxID=1859460 RepID=A0ABT3FHN7_9BACT|nr:phospholipase D family protein [Luteolibacter flavescens]MCW1883093.1 phospholipase D family protein [Luteolibacter flavescens]